MGSLRSSISFGTKNPRRNLPSAIGLKRGEVLFQSAFLRAWHEELDEPGVGGDQFELPELGIADYLWASVSGRLDAFEFKLVDWRKGATQAMRYRSYAHRSFLVMPPTAANRAAQHLESFERLGIGLWSFDVEQGRIVRLHTPEESTPLSAHAYDIATSILLRKRKFRELLEPA